MVWVYRIQQDCLIVASLPVFVYQILAPGLLRTNWDQFQFRSGSRPWLARYERGHSSGVGIWDQSSGFWRRSMIRPSPTAKDLSSILMLIECANVTGWDAIARQTRVGHLNAQRSNVYLVSFIREMAGHIVVQESGCYRLGVAKSGRLSRVELRRRDIDRLIAYGCSAELTYQTLCKSFSYLDCSFVFWRENPIL